MSVPDVDTSRAFLFRTRTVQVDREIRQSGLLLSTIFFARTSAIFSKAERGGLSHRALIVSRDRTSHAFSRESQLINTPGIGGVPNT